MLRDFPYLVNPRLAFLHNYVVIQLDECWFRLGQRSGKAIFGPFAAYLIGA